MYHKIMADGFFVFAAIAILGSIYGWAISDIFLASTQWLLISIVLILMAIYIRLSRDDDEMIVKKQFKSMKTRNNKTVAKRSKKDSHVSFKLSE